MAGFSQASIFMRSSISYTPSSGDHDITRHSIRSLKIRRHNLGVFATKIASHVSLIEEERDNCSRNTSKATDNETMEKLYVILEAVSDRVEMHINIGEQRNNWNNLLLTSINTITLAAATMAGIAAATASVPGAPLGVLKLSSGFMYLAVTGRTDSSCFTTTGMLVIMNAIQPSQLAEEQRSAARLLKQIESEIKTNIALANFTINDVNESMNKVLAIDKAYPLPLLGVMLEKFPAKIKPAVWWPKTRETTEQNNRQNNNKKGWSVELKKEMREIVRVLKVKDESDYLRLGEKALKLNKVLAIVGPVLTGLGAIGSVFLNSSPWAMLVAVMGGAVASVVNMVQHGGQVGMVLEMYRNNAGFFKMMEEFIESSLDNADESREINGDVFEMKVALKLGRSLSELRDVASSSSSSSSSRKGNQVEEFGSKLF